MGPRGARFRGVVVGAAGLALIVTAIAVAVARPAHATARGIDRPPAEPRITSTPATPGITLASSPNTDLPDPFLLAAGNKYYLYLSTAFADATESNIPVISGGPGKWSAVTDALPNVPAWAVSTPAGGTTWGPFVVRLNGKYVMYFAATLSNHTPNSHCIGVALSSTPQGPFAPFGQSPLVCQVTLGGDIDAMVFNDPHGPRGPTHPKYLIWKSDNNNLLGWIPTTIWAAPLSNDGLHLAGKAVAIFRPDRAWEEPLLEAPQMVEAPDGSDWLFFSGGEGYYLAKYAIGAARCKGPLGGCHSVTDNPLLASNAQGAGPGEETVFQGSDHSMWVLYNPWHSDELDALLRPAEAVRIGWDAQGPYIGAAGRFPSPSLPSRTAKGKSSG